MALVAHIDSGKTTLTESILHKSEYLTVPGSVDTGSTTTDFLPAERERGITIQSASIPVKWKKWFFNLIDTPGHADFGMEVESASRVVDGAVVLIDSVEGVESQTKGVWKQLDRYNVPTRMIFLNKLDRAGASFSSAYSSLLAHRFHPRPLPITLPVASFDVNDYSQAKPGIQGVVDLVRWEALKWDEEGGSSTHPLPLDEQGVASASVFPVGHPLIKHLIPARNSLLENLALCSDDLMEQLLETPSYLSVSGSDIIPHLRKATLRNEVLPVLCGSAMKNIGTELVMNYVGDLLASPMDVRLEGESTNAPLRMLAWKVTWDKRKGWMTFVRIYSGSLKSHSTLVNVTNGQKEKVSKLILLYASQAEEVDNLSFGSVGVLLGLKHTRTGDTLMATRAGPSSSKIPTSLRSIVPPPPVISASVMPNSHADAQPVEDALHALARTDPSVRVDDQEGQKLVHGLGALHLEIVEGRLRDEWQVNFEFGARRVSYRETLGAAPGPGNSTWSTEIAGCAVSVHVSLSVSNLDSTEQNDPLWDGNLVLGPDGKRLPPPDSYENQTEPLANIARGIYNSLSSSPHTSLAYSHVKICVKSFKAPQEVTSSVYVSATGAILRERLRAAGMGSLMEPFIKLKIAVLEDSIGKVVKDLSESGGEVLDLDSDPTAGAGEEDLNNSYPTDGLYIPSEDISPSSASSAFAGAANTARSSKRTVNAVAPLSRMLDYSTRLRALTGGHGTFEMSSAGFKEVPGTRKSEILREIGKA
ncbi:P-loop containing nucleoside triphosphate hydrolase protein [Coniophora puteana RWD-64-598 SS2]|uniref:P-loop containing nucleoside triphosphate hydrolase protein n=1 Tax=Coniophora puteana (strain RWD-64-598) TaxID=741705 RepID=A0A5M3MU44_CONPW|nr:P-loop containing nucleoside triphosphate hydrolase protein [Coniophora puteana RWD-64-598 SS2]EIW82101.1 P-loop containing nucleoside triphosphate hydrolase protein [Coniophora puteana RWD-64-598 SS2]